MKYFNIKRFWRTFRWYFVENRRRLLVWGMALTLIFMVVESFFMLVLLHQTHSINVEMNGEQVYDMQKIAVMSSFGFSVLIGMVAVMLAFCNVFSFLKTKQKRIAYLTLPATNLERYFSALLFTVIVWPLCIFLAFVLGDSLRTLIFGLLGEGWLSGLRPFYDGFIKGFWSAPSASWNENLRSIAENCITLWGCSIFLLGGTWFRKGAFFIVTIGLIAFTTFASWLFVTWFGDSGSFVFDTSNQVQHVNSFYCIIILAALVVILFNFWLSYQIFKRFQIVPSKWTNV